MRYMKTRRTALAALLLTAAVVLSGCTSFMGVETLLSPPKLEGDQQEIYDALAKSVSGEIHLVYPRTGSFKSAVTLLNLDEEETDEAIAFYTKSGSNTSAGAVSMPLRVNILDRRDGQWVSVYDMGVSADEVERLDLMKADGFTYLVVGYNFAGTSGKQVKIYRFLHNILLPVKEFDAVNYVVCDIDSDEYDEIVKLVQVSDVGEEGEVVSSHVEAKLVQVMGASFLEGNQVKLYPSVTDFMQIHVGRLRDKTPAIFLDELVGGQMISEILVYGDRGRLKNLMYDGTEESLGSIAPTQRQAGIYSADVDGDGSVEIPQMVPAPGYEMKERYEQIYFTYWNQYDISGNHHDFGSYTDFTLGYLFKMPAAWHNRVTAEVSTVDKEVTFYEYDQNSEERGVPVLSIRVMNRQTYLSQGVSGKYKKLAVNGQFVFLYYTHNEISKLSVEETTIKGNLFFL